MKKSAGSLAHVPSSTIFYPIVFCSSPVFLKLAKAFTSSGETVVMPILTQEDWGGPETGFSSDTRSQMMLSLRVWDHTFEQWGSGHVQFYRMLSFLYASAPQRCFSHLTASYSTFQMVKNIILPREDGQIILCLELHSVLCSAVAWLLSFCLSLAELSDSLPVLIRPVPGTL